MINDYNYMTLREQFESLKQNGYISDSDDLPPRRWGDGKLHEKKGGKWHEVSEGNEKSEEKKEPKVDDKGHPFEVASNGSINFGEVTQKMADAMGTGVAAPIRYSSGDFEYGKKHLEENHKNDIFAYGFDTSNDFVEYVAQNFDEIYKGKTYKEKGKERKTWLLAIKDTKFTLYIELRKLEEDDYYSVGSGGIISHAKEKTDKNRRWSRSTRDSQVADALAGVCACPLFIRNETSEAAMPSSRTNTIAHDHAEVKSLKDIYNRIKGL